MLIKKILYVNVSNNISRLTGASLGIPLINFWWRRVPQDLLNAAMKRLPLGFQSTLEVAHYCVLSKPHVLCEEYEKKRKD